MARYLTLLLLVVLLGKVSPLSAQFEKNYEPIKSTGSLPKDFTTLSSQKYNSAKQNVKKQSNRKSRKTFLLKSSFGLDEILLSGKVLFNDPMTTYLNQVADRLLEHDKALRDKLHFYIIRSTSVNAFATNEGSIFVTMGLLAELENEAQLAFILAHEVVHVNEKHSIERYIQSEKIQKGKGVYNARNSSDKLIEKCLFNKEQETEADTKGADIFFKSPYSTEQVIGVFDVLKFAHLPFDDVTFKPEIFENETLKFPDDYTLKVTRPISLDDDTNDIQSTHPAVKFRRGKIEKLIAGKNNSGKQTYLVGIDKFKHNRECARFEISRLYVLHHDYEAAIYNSYMLLQKYPDNLFLKKNIAFSLAALGDYENESEFREVHTDHEKIEGKQQALYYLFYKLDSVNGDLKTIALAYIVKVRQQYPDDADLKATYDYVLSIMPKNEVRNIDYFYKDLVVKVDSQPQQIAVVNVDTLNNIDSTMDKYAKLRNVQQVTAQAAQAIFDNHYAHYALTPYLKDSSIVQEYEKAVSERKEKDKIEDANQNSRRSKKRYKIYALGQDKVVFVDPAYSRLDARKKEKFRLLKSEGGKLDFAARLQYNAKVAKLSSEMIDSKNLKASDIVEYNELAFLNEYISEKVMHSDDVSIISYERSRVLELAKKYGTDNFVWSGVISYTDKQRVNSRLAILGIFMPIYLPFMISHYVNQGQYTYFYTLVYDVKTDEVKLSNFRLVNNRTKGYILDSNIYDVMNQIKSKPKAPKK